MIRYLAALALFVPLMASAQQVSGDKLRECGQKAWLFSMAAQFRDSRMPPQEFMKYVSHNHPNPLVLDDTYIKRSVNAVYFDDKFAGLSSEVLYSAISEACANPAPQFQPVQ
jgi:hypothetical protein